MLAAAWLFAGIFLYGAPPTAHGQTSPARPDNLELETPGLGQILASWEPPSSTGSAPIESYNVQWSVTGQGVTHNWTIVNTSASETSYTITGLNPLTTYRVRVRAKNQNNSFGDYIAKNIVTLQGLPGAPFNLSLTPGQDWIRASWSGNDNGQGSITRYEVAWKANDEERWWRASPRASNSPPYTIRNLRKGTTYAVKVQASNKSWLGPFSDIVTTTTQGDPEPPDPPEAPKSGDPGTGDQTPETPGDPGTGDQTPETPGDPGTGDQTPETPGDPGTGDQTPETPVTLDRATQFNQALLPRVGQALVAGPLTAVTTRVSNLRRETPAGLTYQLGGQTTLSSAVGALAPSLGEGTLNLAQMLGGSAFSLSLNQAAGTASWLRDVVLWGRGNYQNLSSSSDTNAMAWDGDMVTAQIGVDARVHPRTMAGLMVIWNEGTFSWQERLGGTGDYDVTMTSVHPYVGWTSAGGDIEGWGTVGYGWGDLGLQEATTAQDQSSDGILRTAAVGATGRLLANETLIPGGRTNVRAKGEFSFAGLDMEGGALLDKTEVETSRLRALLQVAHERRLADGGQVAPSLEVGLRHDGGDGLTGTGLETGLGLRYQYPAWGLTVDGQMRFLALSGADYDEWGGSLGVQVDPGSRQEGAMMRLTTGYGAGGSGVQQLWMQDLPGPGGVGPTPFRLTTEVGYGVALTRNGGAVIPYSGITLTGHGSRAYRVGGRLLWDEQRALSLEGAQLDQITGVIDHRILLQAQWHF